MGDLGPYGSGSTGSPSPSAWPSPPPGAEQSDAAPHPTPSTSLTVPTASPADSTPVSNDPTQPPAQFVAWVNTVLQGRVGSLTKYALISDANKQDLIRRLWADPSIQNEWQTLSPQAIAGNASAVASIQSQIQVVMQGGGADPTIATAYTDMLTAAGVQLTTQEQNALALAQSAVNAPVPKPFGTNTVSGYDFGAPMPAGGWSGKAPGQSYGWNKHLGVDYGTPAGSRIVSPFAGTVTVETNVPGYGNYVVVTLDNGYKIGFGHVQNAAVSNGMRVNPGDLVAISGANVGSAEGAVTIVTWQDPSGQYINPHDVLDPIFKGTTFNQLPGLQQWAGALAGTGMPTRSTILDTEYPQLKSIWEKYFGGLPSPEDMQQILAHGKNPQEWEDYIRNYPGPIDGMNVGQAYDTRSAADQVSHKIYGHPANDGIVKELFDAGMMSGPAIQSWYDNLEATAQAKGDATLYNTAYAALAPQVYAVTNQVPDPRTVVAFAQYGKQQAAQQQGGTPADGSVPPTQAAAAAESMP